MVKICFIGDLNSSFVKQDYEILRKHFDVILVEKQRKISSYVKLFFKLLNTMKECDLSFSWFADKHSAIAVFLSNLHKKRSVVVVGGYDVANVPEINYGAFHSPIAYLRNGIWGNYVFKHSDGLLAVSEFTKKELLSICPQCAPKIELVYNGIELSKIPESDISKKENLVVTVGDAVPVRMKVKGIDTFAAASSQISNCRFIIIGEKQKKIEKFLKEKNPNLIFTGRIPHDEVLKILAKAKVYCQLSYRESFGVALAEAMMSSCVPVVTNRGAMPEVVGDTGFYVSYGDVEETTRAIKVALAETSLGIKARERILALFSTHRREKALVDILTRLCNPSTSSPASP